jgi:co-chaperonin GroES (HSP10)
MPRRSKQRVLAKGENRPSTGSVVKVAPGRMASNGQLVHGQVGDLGNFCDYGGSEVDESREYSVVRMADVLVEC